MIKKISQQAPSYWQQLLPKLKQQNYGQYNNVIKKILNDPSKIVFSMPPSGSPNAVAFVSTEDAEGDKSGIEKIHIVTQNMPRQEAGASVEDFIDSIMSSISGVLTHEAHHIQDYDPEKHKRGEDPFPSGEHGAEAAQHQHEKQSSARQDSMSINDLFSISDSFKRNPFGRR